MGLLYVWFVKLASIRLSVANRAIVYVDNHQ